MCTTIRIVLAMVREAFLSRAALHLENLALRQQLAALDRKGARPSLRMADRLFWVVLSRLWSGWREILVIVKPETVIGWHRKGFRRFWTRKSRRGKPGRPPVSSEFRGLIRRMSRENPLWGAPRIHGELRMLGFEVSEAAGVQVHAAPSKATFADMADVPREPRRVPSVDRLLRRTHRDVQSSIRARCAAARASADCSHRHHGTPDCGVGRATDPGGLSVGDSTTVYDPRSGSCVRYCLSFADKGDGHRRGRDGAAIAVAVAVR